MGIEIIPHPDLVITRKELDKELRTEQRLTRSTFIHYKQRIENLETQIDTMSIINLFTCIFAASTFVFTIIGIWL